MFLKYLDCDGCACYLRFSSIIGIGYGEYSDDECDGNHEANWYVYADTNSADGVIHVVSRVNKETAILLSDRLAYEVIGRDFSKVFGLEL